MTYTNTIDSFYDLQNLCWSGASQVLDIVEEHDLEDEFFDYVTSMFDEPPTITEINDFIWFECDDWLEENITTEGETDDEE